MWKYIGITAGIVLVFVSAVTTLVPTIAAADEFEWQTDDPYAHCFHPEKLEDAANWAEENNSGSLLVIHDGAIILEEYWDWFDEDIANPIYSVTKSFTSTLVGIAQQLGYLNIDEPAANYITEWNGTDSATVTIRNLLSGDSGRYWEYYSDFFDGVPQPDDVTQYAINRGQQYPPDTHWQYNHMAIQCLDRVLSEATGMSTAGFAQTYLFDELGMSHTTVALDDTGQMLMYSGMTSTARDMARLGYLYMNNGMWNGARILPEGFVAEATSPNAINPAYGYLWWLNTDETWLFPVSLHTRTETIFPDAPPDMFTAIGREGNLIMVSPSARLVIVRQGEDWGGFNPPLYSDVYGQIASSRYEPCAVVPETSTLILLTVGLLGLGGYAYFRIKRWRTAVV